MTFLKTLEDYGLDVSIRQAGIDFANSGYPLWHANKAGRDNLRKGIAPPDSGHPKFNKHADDIDYQIEADFSGLIAPGLPNTAIALGEIFGRLMNYGDGLYGGQFVGGMYAEAFFENDPRKIVEAGLKCIPEKSQYAECVRDVLRWYKEEPTTGRRPGRRSRTSTRRTRPTAASRATRAAFNIDAKINGAYIVMGLLYGKGDLGQDDRHLLPLRPGQRLQSRRTPAACSSPRIGAAKVPERFTREAQRWRPSSATRRTRCRRSTKCARSWPRQAVVKAGGRIEKTAAGEEVFVIPVQTPKPGKLEQCWEPGPTADSKFTADEMGKIEKK